MFGGELGRTLPYDAGALEDSWYGGSCVTCCGAGGFGEVSVGSLLGSLLGSRASIEPCGVSRGLERPALSVFLMAPAPNKPFGTHFLDAAAAWARVWSPGAAGGRCLRGGGGSGMKLRLCCLDLLLLWRAVPDWCSACTALSLRNIVTLQTLSNNTACMC